jgi:hypothetical protein
MAACYLYTCVSKTTNDAIFRTIHSAIFLHPKGIKCGLERPSVSVKGNYWSQDAEYPDPVASNNSTAVP